MLVPNRHGSGDLYRYGYQGQEKDDEIKGEGNSLNYTFRMHDPRVGRFFTKDPLTHKYAYYSPYQFAGNKVIQFVELEGLEEGPSGAMSCAGTLNFAYNIGGKGKSNFKLGIGFSAMANGSIGNAAGQAGLNFSASLGNGGLTSRYGNRSSDIMFEYIISPSATVGVLNQNTSIMPVNYLHGNATTALENPMKYSFMWALNFHKGTHNRDQRTATYGIRIGGFSLNVLEDHHAWKGADGEDRYWTGSGNLNYQFPDGTMMTIGTDTYTGNSNNKGDTAESLCDYEVGGLTKTITKKGLTFYWANQEQNDDSMGLPRGYNQSLNNAQTYLQVSSSRGIIRMTSTGPANFWSQNTIHDFLSPNFHHFKSADSKNKWEVYFAQMLNFNLP